MCAPSIAAEAAAADGLAAQLAAAGIDTLILDMRGHGASGGTPYEKQLLDAHAVPASSWLDTGPLRGEIRRGAERFSRSWMARE
ncbi:MAG TPA: hypothetical protein VGG67_03890, partial [Steroidobacteraceae bacterium]